MVPQRRRPPRQHRGGLGGPKAKEASTPMRWGPRSSQSEGGLHANAEGASVLPKRRRPPRQQGGGLGGPTEGGPHALAEGASVVPK